MWSHRLFIHQSQATVEIETDEEPFDIFTYRNRAARIIATLTDLIGYLGGTSFDVDIISANRQETGETIIFGNEIPILYSRKDQTSTRELKTDLIIAANASPSVQMILEDFRHAMHVPVGTGFFCFRAIEAMMQSVKVQPNEKDDTAWRRLRELLRVERAVIDEIKAHADFPRHGRPSSISDQERAKIFERTDEIIRRYLEYVLRGKQLLPGDEFPMMTA